MPSLRDWAVARFHFGLFPSQFGFEARYIWPRAASNLIEAAGLPANPVAHTSSVRFRQTQ
jgi:hypothetical protein